MYQFKSISSWTEPTLNQVSNVAATNSVLRECTLWSSQWNCNIQTGTKVVRVLLVLNIAAKKQLKNCVCVYSLSREGWINPFGDHRDAREVM